MEYGPYEGVNLRTPPPEIIEFFFAKGYSMEKLDMTVEEIHHNW